MNKMEENRCNQVPFTEYIRPNGGQRQQHLEMDSETATLARRCINRGARFTAELMPADLVALTCEYAGDDLVMRIAKNEPSGEDLRKSAKSLIEAAHNLIEKEG